MIPSGQEDIALFLEICDRIRSREIGAKEAMRSLKRRLSHRNPNVQLLALKLTDICVKNGGSLFLGEIASREFMDGMVGLINASGTNAQVKTECLALVAAWALAFRSKPNLTYAIDTFNSLKSQGHSFPANQQLGAAAAMLDTQEAPEWSDSETCDRCRSLFTLTNRKHHCRNCGKTFCNACSKNQITLPHLGINKEVRVCDGCYQKLTGSSEIKSSPVSFESPFTSSGYPGMKSSGSSGGKSAAELKEEEELQRAIALSMLEAEKSKSATPESNNSKRASPSGKSKQKPGSDEDDPELAAAIAASLNDMAVSQRSSSLPAESSSSSIYPSAVVGSSSPPPSKSPNPPSTSRSEKPAQASNIAATQSGLKPVDLENIKMFHLLMEKMDADPSGSLSLNITQDKDLRVLHETMIQLHPHLVKEIEECVEKHKKLMDIHERLTGAVRIYDRLYEARIVAMKQAQQAAQQQAMLAQQQYSAPMTHPAGYQNPPHYGYGPPQPPYQQTSMPPNAQPGYIPDNRQYYPPQQAVPQPGFVAPPANPVYVPVQHQYQPAQTAPHVVPQQPPYYPQSAPGYVPQQHPMQTESQIPAQYNPAQPNLQQSGPMHGQAPAQPAQQPQQPPTEQKPLIEF